MLVAQAKTEQVVTRSAPTLGKVTRVVETALPRVLPLYQRAQRNIFAPLTTVEARPLLRPVTTTGATLRLAAMVDTVTFQETAETFAPEEKARLDSVLAEAFAKFPPRYVDQLATLTLKKSRTGSRGLGGAQVMILRTVDVPEAELVAVAIHELGHVVDMGVFGGSPERGASTFVDGREPVWQDDRSLEFYRLSWQTETTKHRDARPEDFVSGYAMQDPFEDFAESFVLYVLHGERFRRLAEENTVLRAKYAHVRDVIFGGREFAGIDRIPEETDLRLRPWDVTREPYDRAAFALARFY